MKGFFVCFYLHELPREVCFWGESACLLAASRGKRSARVFSAADSLKTKAAARFCCFLFGAQPGFGKRLRFECLFSPLEITLVPFPCR